DQLRNGHTLGCRHRLQRVPERGFQRDRCAVTGDGKRALHGPAHDSASRASAPRPIRNRRPGRVLGGRVLGGACSLIALGGAILASEPVEPARFQGALGGVLIALALGDAEPRALLVGPALPFGSLLVLAVAVQVDDVAHHASGPIILLGSTIRSNSSADT